VPQVPTGRVTGFNVAAVYGVDLDRSRDFYVNTLGLTFESANGPGVMLKAGDLTVYLEGERTEGTDVGLHRACTSLCFATDSVKAAHDRLATAGVPVVQPYQEMGPSFAMFRVADPDGNVVEFAGAP
jgi:catechol 2,3-dioxygenase-like lactoylglutathione lyase family enzyme